MKISVNNSLFWSGLLSLLSSSLISCNAERVAVGPAPPREQEITRFRAKNPTKQPFVFGQVELIDKSKTYVLPSAILQMDEKISHANESGHYGLETTPGTHPFMAGQIGLYQSRLMLQVAPGDSIRINFHLRVDPTPLE